VCENEEPDNNLCLEVKKIIVMESFVCICQQIRLGIIFHHFLGFMWVAHVSMHFFVLCALVVL
jgi:hypothetical protein